MLLEHLFAGAIMSHMWLRGTERVEILKPQVDNGGYDLVLEANAAVRHIQLKASHRGSTTSHVNINMLLGEKPSGCVIWMLFDPTNLQLGPFLWFGAEPGEALPEISAYPVATHTRHNAAGVRPERPNIRAVPKSAFTRIDSLDEVVERLFGMSATSAVAQHDYPNAANPSV
jgi:hypothetical protein